MTSAFSTDQPQSASLTLAHELVEILACPDCRRRLNEQGERLVCETCEQSFPVAAGGSLPILFSRHSELASDSYATWRPSAAKGTKVKGYREARRLPATSVSKLSEGPWRKFLEAVGEGRLLNIGSGQKSVTTNLQRWVNLDIAPHNNVDVVGDGHWLPFADNSFDAVVSKNVFAYLKNPFQVGAEINRVLRPGGLMWCNEAFALPRSLSPPRDCFRYAPDGFQAVFAPQETVDVGAALGPFAVIGRYAEFAAEALFPGKAGFASRWCTAWALQPFKYLDDWIVKRSPEAATAFYFIGRKPAAGVQNSSPVS